MIRGILLILALVGLSLTAFIARLETEARQGSLFINPLATSRLSTHAESTLLESGLYPIDAARIIFDRNPRHEASRFFLAKDALQRGHPQDFMVLYVGLFETDRSNTQIYAEDLARIVLENNLHDVVFPALQEKPYWARAYLQFVLANTEGDVSRLLPAFNLVPSAQPLYLTRLIQNDQWEQAYIAFQHFVGKSSDSNERIYDSEFKKNGGPKPFNWQLSRLAEFSPGGGLRVFFDGRGSPQMVRQTFSLEKGAFLFSVKMSGYASEEVGQYQWLLKCEVSKTVLMKVRPPKIDATPQVLQYQFVNDEEACDFVTLVLQGVAGRFPQNSNILVQEVNLQPIRRVAPE